MDWLAQPKNKTGDIGVVIVEFALLFGVITFLGAALFSMALPPVHALFSNIGEELAIADHYKSP